MWKFESEPAAESKDQYYSCPHLLVCLQYVCKHACSYMYNFIDLTFRGLMKKLQFQVYNSMKKILCEKAIIKLNSGESGESDD